MSLLQEIRDSTQELKDRNLDAELVASCHHNHLINTIKRLVTPAKLDKMSNEKLEALLEFLES